MRALGIDFGERRIGLAISDPEGRWALPLETFERRSDRQAAHRIADVVRREGVERLVLGEPRQFDGTPGESAERVRRFGARLAKITGLEVEAVGEALTTVEATARLEAVPGKTVSQGAIDAVAAQILLQEALDLSGGDD